MTTDDVTWTKLFTADHDTTQINVQDLITGQKYRFRVSAVNKLGSSKPLESDKVVPSKPIGKMQV